MVFDEVADNAPKLPPGLEDGIAPISNFLYVRSPDSSKVSPTEVAIQTVKLRQDLEAFGHVREVSEVWLEDEKPMLRVLYADDEAAKKAKEALGSVVHEPSVENATCPRSTQEEASASDEDISSTTASSQWERSMTGMTEMLDSAPVYLQAPEAPLEAPNEEASSTTSEVSVEPRKIIDFRLSQLSWDDLAKNRELRTTLKLRGLPRHLCSEEALEALLGSFGLAQFVEWIQEPPPGGVGRLGWVIINATGQEGVEKLARFFHGRQFGSCTPVAVSFAGPLSKVCLPKHGGGRRSRLAGLLPKGRIGISQEAP